MILAVPGIPSWKAWKKSFLAHYPGVRILDVFPFSGSAVISVPDPEELEMKQSTQPFIPVSGKHYLLPSPEVVLEDDPTVMEASDIPWHLRISDPLYEVVQEEQADLGRIALFVIDTGVNAAHPDLAGYIDLELGRHYFSVFENEQFLGVEWDKNISDTDGHGTLVTGVINGRNTGVLPGTMVIPLKADDEKGLIDIYSLLGAVDYVLELKAGVLKDHHIIVNFSFNSEPEGDGVFLNFFDEILSRLAEKGVLFIGSAGNNDLGLGYDVDETPVYPTFNESPNFLSVSSVNETGFIDFFSNIGDHTVEIAAPGSLILTTDKDLSLREVNGTSFASPFAAAIAAMVWALDPDLQFWQVRNLLIRMVRGQNVKEDFITEYKGTYPEFTGLMPLELASSEYGTLNLDVIAGKALYPSIISGIAPELEPSPSFDNGGGGGCNFLTLSGGVWLLLPLLLCFVLKRRHIPFK
jgi:subtilisin family serine protease